MENCRHIFVTSELSGYTSFEDIHCCIKCGLEQQLPIRVAEQIENLLEFKDSIWLDDIYCSKNLALAIYQGIIKSKPDISDELIVEYFRIALYMMKKNKVSDNVYAKRLRRLGVKNTNWYKIY